MSKEIFERIVKQGVYMALEGAQISLVVAVLSRTNGMDPAQAVRLKERIVKELR